MRANEIAKIITDFVDIEYPKGHDDRGFALVCLTMFLMFLDKKESRYKIVKK